jgi:hypothetical protein
VQGQQYELAVYYTDSTIIVNNQARYGDVLRLPALDSAFQGANVDSVRITEPNDSTRLLTMYFNKDAAYRLYKLTYDKAKYLIRKIEYYVKGMPDRLATADNITGLITVTLTNYSETVIEPALFGEERFFYKSNGELYLKAPYTSFKLYNHTITKQAAQNETNF